MEQKNLDARKIRPIIKKILSVFMALIMLVSTVSVAFAADGRIIIKSGSCGDEVYYTLYDDGELLITGEGETYDFEEEYRYSESWIDGILKDDVKEIIIDDGVTSIGANMFSGFRYIEKLEFADSIRYIGEYAFECCEIGGGVVIPKRTEIYDHAFSNSSIYGGLTISEGVKYIGEEAFYNCLCIEDIYIPASVENIGTSAFAMCYQLEEITVDEDNEFYASEDGVLYNSDKTELIVYPAGKSAETYIIPSTVTRLADYAFGGSSIEYMTVPDNVTETGRCAFYDCSDLVKITIGDSVTYMRDYTFAYCENLTYVELNADIEYIDDSMFYECTSLREIVIPDTVGTIYSCSFSGCTSLERVTIPVSVTEIFWGVFENCESITDVYYEGSQSQWNKIYIDEGNSCLLNAEIHFGSDEEEPFITDGDVDEPTTEPTTSPDGDVMTDGDIDEPTTEPDEERTVVESGECGVDGDNVTWTLYSDGELVISGYGAMADYPEDSTPFLDYRDIRKVVIENGVTSIGEAIFLGCSGISSVDIPASVTEIRNNAFQSTTALTDIYYEGTETQWNEVSIGNYNYCLEDVTVHFGETEEETTEPATTESETTAHTHTEVTVPGYSATCTNSGLTDGIVCSTCGETIVEQEPISSLGHDMGEFVETKAPTCTANGESKSECSRCDYFETKSIPAVSHSYNSVVTAPTCTASGYTTYTCKMCQKGYTDNVVDALGHDMGEFVVTKAPTCTASGVKAAQCTRCTYTQTETVPAFEHSYDAVVTAPTCTDSGYTTYTCKMCGNGYTDNVVDALGHDMGEFVVTKAPTCVEAGKNTSECSRCDYTETEDIPVIAHSYSSVVTAPACTANGYTTHTCTVCGNSYTDNVTPALGHTEVIDEAVAATCTESGLTEGKHCSVCEAVLTEQTVVSALGHDMGDYVETKAPTCVENGEKTAECSRCDYTETESVPVTEHNYVAVETEATCIENGYTTYTCSYCGDSYIDDISAALGHTEETLAAIEPTCTETGLTEGIRCSVCGETLLEQREIPAKGHTEQVLSAVYATCTSTGLTAGKKCSVCDVILVEQTVVPAKGHSDANANNLCDFCGKTITEQPTTKPITAPTTEEPDEEESEDDFEEGEYDLYLEEPTGLKAKSIKTNSLKLSWDAVEDAESYIVYYSADGEEWAEIGVDGTNVTIKNLETGTKYQFKVAGVLEGEEGEESEIFTTSTKPEKVELKTLKSKAENKMIVTWARIAGVNGYEVVYSTSKKFKKKNTNKVTIKKQKTKKVVIKKLKSGKKYYVKVRAYITVNDKKIYGAYSKVMNVKVK